MVQNPPIPSTGLFAPQSAGLFAKQADAQAEGQPKADADASGAFDEADDMLDQIAARLYSLASMMVGEGEQSVLLVEEAIATADVSACDSPVEARKSGNRALARAALAAIARREPDSFAAPMGTPMPATCIDDDDLEAAGVSSEELERMLTGPDRDRVREWLAKLSPSLRTIFALRAVAGFTPGETAELLAGYGGPSAAGWSPDSVRDVFRQGLCSLASQLLHAATPHRG